MTLTAVLPGKRTRFNFRNLFAAKDTRETPVQDSHSHALFDWLETSPVLTAVEFRSLPAGRILGSNQLYAKFRLRQDYQDSFVLLRGLLEFSRPKEIAVSANSPERSFEVWLPEDQAPRILAYFETIITRLLREIRFKASLKMIVKYEAKVKQEQARLYEALRVSVY